MEIGEGTLFAEPAAATAEQPCASAFNSVPVPPVSRAFCPPANPPWQEDTDLPAHRDNNIQCYVRPQQPLGRDRSSLTLFSNQGPTCYDDNTGLHFGTANNCCRQCLVDVYGYEWRAATGEFGKLPSRRLTRGSLSELA